MEQKTVVFYLDHLFGELKISLKRKKEYIIGIDLWPESRSSVQFFKERAWKLILLVPCSLSKREKENLAFHVEEFDEILSTSSKWEKALSKHTHISKKGRPLFVCIDRFIRSQAIELGFQTVASPSLAKYTANNEALSFVQLVGEKGKIDYLKGFVPYYKEIQPDNSVSLIGHITSTALSKAVCLRFKVNHLNFNEEKEDLLLLQLDETNKESEQVLGKHKVILSDGSKILIALDKNRRNEEIGLHGFHGHTLYLMPNPNLLLDHVEDVSHSRREELALENWPLEELELKVIDKIIPIYPLFKFRNGLATSFQADVDRFAGLSPIDAMGNIQSRHILHPDNSRAVNALINDLSAMGYCTYTHTFTYNGQQYRNVIADLPGRGYFQINCALLKAIRKLLLNRRQIARRDSFCKQLAKIAGDQWVKDQGLYDLSPVDIYRRVADIFLYRPWYPWQKNDCYRCTIGAKIVLVGCHLDSTAASDFGYNPVVDPAPGADDDASGIAGTLAVARYLSHFKGKLRHTVRFAFFNAEESGLIGSRAYASSMRAYNAPIKAVICMDMIGYNSDQNRIFEIHAGYTNPAIRDLSLPIAQSIQNWTNSLGIPAQAQIYYGTSSSTGAPDRSLYDGAINRSDHASFHEQGYPAVVVSEDFFVNLAAEPGADPNPNYHRASDTAIDSSFGADIACAVGYAVKDLAS